MKFFKKLKNNNKGNLSFNRVLCYLIFIYVFAFSCDICLLFAQTVVTNFETAFLAEKIAIQGGLIGDYSVLPGEINGQVECSSCYNNIKITERTFNTLRHFGVNASDYEITLYHQEKGRIGVYEEGTNIAANSKYGSNYKLRYDYMDVGELTLTTYFRPKISKFFWNPRIKITKTVPFVSAYLER